MPASPSQIKVPGHRDPALDGLRGVAILLVFLFHYGGGLRAHNPLVRAVGYLTQAGWIGVELFFVLSGYLITGLLFDTVGQPRWLRNFYARRALRILPLYGLALLLCAGAALLEGAQLVQLKPVLLYVGFLQNQPGLARVALHTPPPLPLYHLWSLAVEEQFYLLWPLLLWLTPTRRRASFLCAGLFCLSLVFRMAVWLSPLQSVQIVSELLITLPARAGALAAGGWLALHAQRRDQSQPVLWLVASAAGAVFVLAGYRAGSFLLAGGPSSFVLLTSIDVCCVALLAAALHQGSVRKVLSVTPFGLLGRVSYGFYVFHILLEPLFDRLGAVLAHSHAGFAYQTARLLVAFPITLLATVLSFAVFEGPILRWKARFPREEFKSELPRSELLQG